MVCLKEEKKLNKMKIFKNQIKKFVDRVGLGHSTVRKHNSMIVLLSNGETGI